MAKKETDKAVYYYTVDKDEDFCNLFFLTVQTIYKGTNREAVRVYIIDK